ncbi:MAG: LysR family transcriptional regulator [Pseudomonadota bacterium]
MDRLREIEIFLAIVAEESLAGAARRLSVSAPAVTRALARLEDRLGAALVVRTTRSLALTPAGEAYATRARDALTAFDEADAAVSETRRTLSGLLTLTAPLQFGRIAVAPVLAEFLEAEPLVRARFLLLDRVVHLLDEGIDLGVRIGMLEDTSAIVRRLGEVRQYLVASPCYLKKNGRPEGLDALSGHRLIGFSGRMRGGRLPVRGGSVPFGPVHIEINSAAAALELAEDGHGIAPLFSYQCAASVRAGRLVPVLVEEMPPPVPCHFIWPERRFENPLVRAFVDHAAPQLSAILRDASEACAARRTAG